MSTQLIVSTISVASAVVVSLRHAPMLHIGINELPRYLRKSFYLALGYVGFMSEQSHTQAKLAGLAAFLCCAYDVVTDWRGFKESDVSVFDNILRQHTAELRDMALDLLRKDQRGELSHDGLERGVTSVRFITGLVGSRSHFEGIADLERLGMALQVVDDVVDYEEDIQSGETNCLSSPRWEDYIVMMQKTLTKSETARLFPNAMVLRYVIGRANEKALNLRHRLKRHHQPAISSRRE